MELTSISSIKSELGDDNPARGGVELPVPRRSVVAPYYANGKAPPRVRPSQTERVTDPRHVRG
jgi:hypothetical protein